MYEKQKYLLDKKIEQAGLDTTIPWFIAGGALTSVFSGKPINDLDVFFYCAEDFTALQEKIEGTEVKPSFETNSAISYELNGVRVQLIRKFFGSVWDIIDKFDFTICMAAYAPTAELSIDKFVFNPNFFCDLAQRTLHYVPGDYPIASLWRVKKFLKRDFTLPAVESIKLALSINNLKITTYEELKDQLEGIDTLFLKGLTDAMIEKKDEVYDFNEALVWMEEVLTQMIEE